MEPKCEEGEGGQNEGARLVLSLLAVVAGPDRTGLLDRGTMTSSCRADITIADCVIDEMTSCPISDAELAEFIEPVKRYGIKSPPEQLFLYAWLRVVNGRPIHPQTQISNYRADFTVSALDHFRSGYFSDELIQKMNIPIYVIEIDGFEWHDKTPEQAEHDRKRDRFMTSLDYRVIRFSAREVFREPYVCALEVSARIENDIFSIYNRLTIQ